ncbi:hypothetical protein BC833DRAFT_658862 [Globomyces pollinis-pini]|nr:hypothetical protein BC833DRAFT_658862 [Globomyces pollinis-pini]KAJ2994414.1 hypothetical protein HDV02_001589 [Globomyces sp. JEL0801]
MKTIAIYDVCSKIPFFGRWIFSCLVSFFAPYTGTLPFRVYQLSDSICEVRMTEYFWLKNPFNSVHAAALTNLGEATMGMAVISWAELNNCKAIPSRLEVDFHKKAKGTLTAICKMPEIIQPNQSENSSVVTTHIYNSKDELVCTVKGNWKVSRIHKKNQ